MTPTTPPPSSRLLRAAAAERPELDRHRQRLLRAREELQAELGRVEAGLAEVDERRRLLDRLAPAPPAGPAGPPPDRDALGVGQAGAVPLHDETAGTVGAHVLRGPAVRETAVRLLLTRGDGITALHYREWFEMVTGEGFAVAGRDPLAVFLTQISRSPVVRRSTQAGVYEIDRDAPARLRRELERLHEQLREVATATVSAGDLQNARARRQELTTRIGRVEKALQEATGLLDAVPVPDLVGVA
jgi:hypothetical protein